MLAACVCGVLHVSMQTVFTSTLSFERSKVLSRPTASAEEAPSTERDDRKEHLSTNKRPVFNATLELEAAMKRHIKNLRTVQGPPWATCVVEYIENGRNMLEEWVMRGDAANVDAFRSWRECNLESANVRCEPTPPRASEQLTCIECVRHAGSSLLTSPGGSSTCDGIVDKLHAEVSMAFTDWDQCMAQTVGGASFCKSGNVAVVL